MTTLVETDQSEWQREKKPNLKPEYYGCPETPCAIEIPRKSVFISTITYPGYEPAEIAVGFSADQNQMIASMAGQTGTAVATGGAAGAALGTIAVVGAQVSMGVLSAGSPTLGGPTLSGGIVASATATGLGVGLAFGLTSAVVDTGTGAYLNLTPNPVIIILAPEGTPTVVDPNVEVVRQFLAEEKRRILEQGNRSNFEENRRAAEDCRKKKRRESNSDN